MNLKDLWNVQVKIPETKMEYSGDIMGYWLRMKALELRGEFQSQPHYFPAMWSQTRHFGITLQALVEMTDKKESDYVWKEGRE